MCHAFLSHSRFWLFLLSIDRDFAEAARQEGCACGGRLDSARFPRKPRGAVDDLPEGFDRRFSFCCHRDGCRRRRTPPSVRFLGRHVYLGAVVALVTAMRQGLTPRGERRLERTLGVDRRTIGRWKEFWEETFPRSAFWRIERGRFPAGADERRLPRVLLEAFRTGIGFVKPTVRLLRFVSPITDPKSRLITVSDDRSRPAEDAR